MLKGLFGPNTTSSMLRGGLEETGATHRGIAARVAALLTSSSPTDFATALEAQAAELRRQQDLDREMTSLADTQLRYEADAKLLQQVYGRLRTAIKSHG